MKNQISNTSGRKPKLNPATNRYSIRFNDEEHARFLSLFEQSEMKVKAHFITHSIFNSTIKVIKMDKSASDYHIKLTQLFGQFRAIGTNYNQCVKALQSNFSEKKAMAFLYKLEQATKELIKTNNQILELTQEFEEKWLQK